MSIFNNDRRHHMAFSCVPLSLLYSSVRFTSTTLNFTVSPHTWLLLCAVTVLRLLSHLLVTCHFRLPLGFWFISVFSLRSEVIAPPLASACTWHHLTAYRCGCMCDRIILKYFFLKRRSTNKAVFKITCGQGRDAWQAPWSLIFILHPLHASGGWRSVGGALRWQVVGQQNSMKHNLI